ncbi:MAG TPA: hypothetical protein PKY50_12785 [Candidatus Competibacter sp.]|nr:hypothetical protein [Candidatus Competibacter sp.]
MTALEIEWRHLEKDGRTCLRCSDTGVASGTRKRDAQPPNPNR